MAPTRSALLLLVLAATACMVTADGGWPMSSTGGRARLDFNNNNNLLAQIALANQRNTATVNSGANSRNTVSQSNTNTQNQAAAITTGRKLMDSRAIVLSPFTGSNNNLLAQIAAVNQANTANINSGANSRNKVTQANTNTQNQAAAIVADRPSNNAILQAALANQRNTATVNSGANSRNTVSQSNTNTQNQAAAITSGRKLLDGSGAVVPRFNFNNNNLLAQIALANQRNAATVNSGANSRNTVSQANTNTQNQAAAIVAGGTGPVSMGPWP